MIDKEVTVPIMVAELRAINVPTVLLDIKVAVPVVLTYGV